MKHFAESAMKELIVAASLERLDEVISFVNTEMGRHGCSPELQNQVDLAVEEIFVNIANHAYVPASGGVVMSIAVVGDEVVIRFEDTGRFFNPLEHPDPDLEKPLTEREIGGLGIFFVKKTMDKIDYKRVGDKNLLVMTKRIK